MVKTSTAGARVQPLVGELRSHMPRCSQQKKKRVQFVWFRDPVKTLISAENFHLMKIHVCDRAISGPVVVDHRLSFFLAAPGLHCCAGFL